VGYIGRGKIEEGKLVLSGPLPFPEGAEVVVQIEPVVSDGLELVEDFASLPFFGLWADRDDLIDSMTWVRERRKAWHQRDMV
jgi:hypothetical protein